MSIPIASGSVKTAPTPQNTPLSTAPISQGMSRPTVPDISEEGEDGATGMSQAMLGLVQGKLGELGARNNDYIESLPLSQKLRLQALKGVQSEQDELLEKFELEHLELDKKYHELRQPLYTRRNELVHGIGASPSKEEIDQGQSQSTKEDANYEPLSLDVPDDGKGIPKFWLTALKNHLTLADIVTKKDEPALESLRDLRLAYLDDKHGFKLSFHFDPNEFFENEVLYKTYIYKSHVGYWGDLVYDKSIGTEIKWKEDKNLTKEITVKKQRNKNTNQTRLVKKAVPIPSFFNFFDPPQPPEDDDDSASYDSEYEDLQNRIEADYQLGEDLKEKVIPKAVDYFTAVATKYDILAALSDEEDWDDDEEDGDEGDEED
ncbi:NAP-domain-containing protein [Flagelloscypha sp. PMI_526]|nr:NAP-domain-containing protein [Flagelloscypha sp. PMI_526]